MKIEIALTWDQALTLQLTLQEKEAEHLEKADDNWHMQQAINLQEAKEQLEKQMLKEKVSYKVERYLLQDADLVRA